MIKLIVGLGNPGPEYLDTRHNAGFWWVDEAAQQLRVQLQPERAFFGLVAKATGPEGIVWLLEPQTFMNRSGQAVGALARFYKIPPESILVVHDELDLPAGTCKIKLGGGHAGHNGLKDIAAAMGSPNFWRLRLGIGHPGDRNEVAGYVLRKPPASEKSDILQAIWDTQRQLPALLKGDFTEAQRHIHSRDAKS